MAVSQRTRLAREQGRVNRLAVTLIRWSFVGDHQRLVNRALRRAAITLFLRTLTKCDNALLSAYDVWLHERVQDQTFRFCLTGGYGFMLSDWLRDYEQPFVFLDIGANVGLYSLVALSNPRARWVQAFEPDPSTLPFLKANLRAADSTRFAVTAAALSDHPGTASLVRSSEHSGISTLRKTNLKEELFDDAVTVELRDFHYLDANVTIPSGCDVVVKLDVEGHEQNVLDTLIQWRDWRSVSAVCVELDYGYSDTDSIVNTLREQGFVEHCRTGKPKHHDAIFVRRPTVEDDDSAPRSSTSA